MENLFLFDANSLIHRAFHALPPFTSPKGDPTGALYGLSSILLKVLREDKPEYVAALFDRPEPTFREEEYKEYKAQRPPAPQDLISQIIEARTLFGKFGIRVFEKPGYEADDLIATLSERFKEEAGLRLTIFTGDMDTLQLVEGDKVMVKILKKGVSDTVLYNQAAVLEKYGLSPNQMVDYKSLVGDVSDNIKGVSGIGPKTAVKLLQEHGSIERVFEHEEILPAKVRANIQGARAAAEMAKRLVILRKDAPIETGSIRELALVTDYRALGNYFASLGFDSLVRRLSSVVSLDQTLF